jgi:uncharacterized membrane protein YdjX (TVP38/TMEM64 family)
VSDATESEKPGRSGWIKLAALGALVVGSTLAFWYSGVADRVTVGQIRATRESLGPLAPVLFVVVYVVGTVLAFPGIVLTLAGGLLFGTFVGGSLVLVGASAGAILAFLVARHAGRSTVVRYFAGGRLERFDRAVTDSGFSAVLFTRLVPVVPFNVVNFLWGLTGVRLRDYVLGTVVGMIPAEYVYANIGGAIARSLEGTDSTLGAIDYTRLLNRDVTTAIALLGLLAGVPTLVKLVRDRRARARGAASAGDRVDPER